jgi:hypothetical protein
MAGPEGLEPPTLWFEARCSIQLSYGPTFDLIIFRLFCGGTLGAAGLVRLVNEFRPASLRSCRVRLGGRDALKRAPTFSA